MPALTRNLLTAVFFIAFNAIALRAAAPDAIYEKAILHFDAGDAGTITLENGVVAIWKSARGRGVLRAPSASGRPEYNRAGGKKPSVRFDAKKRHFLALSGAPGLRLGAVSIYVVARFNNEHPDQYIFGTGDGDMCFDLYSDYRQFATSIGNELHAIKRGAKMDTAAHIFELTHVLLPADSGILAPGRYTVDGAVGGRPFTRSTEEISGSLTFGARGGAGGFFSGDIHEIIIFREELTVGERDTLRAALGEKWGVRVIPEKLPAGIPELKPVVINQPGEFASLGIYQQTPESPDGRRLAYVTFGRPSTKEDSYVPFTIWIRDRELREKPRALPQTGHLATSHNGAVLQWVDDSTLACAAFVPPARPGKKPRRVVQLLDAETGKVTHGPFYGAFLGEGVSRGRILLGVDGPGNVGPNGVYIYDTRNSRMTRVVSVADMKPFLDGMQWPTMKNSDQWTPTHPHFSPGGKRIGICLAPGGGVALFFVCNDDGSDLRYWGMDEPLHQLWFDDDTISGSDELVNDGEPDNLDIRRWTLDRRLVETLGGPANHPALSPDREWSAGETFYAGSPIVLHVYRRGQTTPAAIIPIENPKVIWRDNGHVNPSFSRDGRRLYFHTSTKDNLKQACYADLSSLIDAAAHKSR